jgi:hypothetical protein
MTTQEAAEYINSTYFTCNGTTISNLRARGEEIPCIKLSKKRYLYYKEDIDAWMEKRRIKSLANGHTKPQIIQPKLLAKLSISQDHTGKLSVEVENQNE